MPVQQIGVKYAPLPRNYIDGGELSWTSSSVLTVSSCVCRDSSDVANITTTGSLTCDYAVFGAGGRDGIYTAVDRGLYFFVISQEDGTANTLMSPNSTPSLPSGYLYYRMIGFTFRDASSGFEDFTQVGSGRLRRHNYRDFTKANILSAGSATIQTALDASDYYPNGFIIEAHLSYIYIPSGVNSTFVLNPQGGTMSGWGVGLSGTTPGRNQITMEMDRSSNVIYRVTSGDSLFLYAFGCTFEV